ncbi:hypothetical protein [Microbacterium sp. HJ5]
MDLAPARHRHAKRTVLLFAAVVLLGSLLAPAAPAHAAARGTGFGTWAPTSAYGWHGSMLVGGTHTYCILPGAPAPTGPTTDRGIRTSVAGLSAPQLAGINLLVTKYGQTGDPVQAAAVSWAVKAIADWDAALGGYGYRGDSLAGAVNWTFSALAPAHNAEIQRRAVAYYDEARRVAVPPRPSGSLVFTTDAADHRAGTVTAQTAAAGATGTLALTGATFVLSGTSTLSGAKPGVAYEIETAAGLPGRAQSVSGTGRFTVGVAAAVRHFTTPGGQDTAGPGGGVAFDIAGKDAAPRAAVFVPVIATQVRSAYASGGAFVDDVTVVVDRGEWPRDDRGRFLPLTASAVVYRTEDQPSPASGVPAHAVAVGALQLTTDPAVGPDAAHRVTSAWTMDAPGYYTAVWTIRADAQSDPSTLRLPAGYEWTERFGVVEQVTMVPGVSSRAQTTVEAGGTISDTVIIAAPLPPAGLDVSSALYRAAAGVAAADTCVEDRLVWSAPTQRVTVPGEITVTSPPVDEPGVYYWQERAVDAEGALVHLGVCGIAAETSTVLDAPPPEPSPSPTPTAPAVAPPAEPPAPEQPGPPAAPPLAKTGLPGHVVRTIAGAGIALLTLGATLLSAPRRRRFEAPSAIG